MKRFIEDSQGARGSQVAAHVLFNQCRSHSQYEHDIRADPRHKADCIGPTLGFYKAFADPAEGSGFVWTSRRPYSTRAFINLNAVVETIVDRLKL